MATLFVGFPCLAEKISSGKTVSVRLTNSVYSNSKTHQTVAAVVDKDVKDLPSDKILIKRGTPVIINADVKKARGVGKPAFVKLDCVSTTAVDGQEIRLQGSYTMSGESNRGLALGLGVGLGFFLWPALFCLCIKGEKINLPQDMLINNVVVNDDYIVKVE